MLRIFLCFSVLSISTAYLKMIEFIQLESFTFLNLSKNNSSSRITMYPIINMLMVMGVVWLAGNVCVAQTAMMQNDGIAVRYESPLKTGR